MAWILKAGISDADAYAVDKKVEKVVVADILEDIRLRGDEAVRELSQLQLGKKIRRLECRLIAF